jgi:hypothetical protein
MVAHKSFSPKCIDFLKESGCSWGLDKAEC